MSDVRQPAGDAATEPAPQEDETFSLKAAQVAEFLWSAATSLGALRRPGHRRVAIDRDHHLSWRLSWRPAGRPLAAVSE